MGLFMARKQDRTRHVTFYRAVILKDGAKIFPTEPDWEDSLKRIAKRPLSERKVEGLIFDPVEVHGQHLLGIHKPMNTQFMSSIDEEAATVTDLLESNDGSRRRFAQSSAVLFTGLGHVFALALGHQHAPRHTAVETFLTHYFPLPAGEHWTIEPFLDRAKILKLKAAGGVVEFSTKFTTKRDLFTLDDPKDGIVTYAERVAAAVGSDLEVKIQITLPKEYRGQESRRRMKDVVMRDLTRTTGEGSRARAVAMVSEGVEEELSLVAHKLAAEFELPELGSEQRQFSNLMAGLQSVSTELQDRVKELLEG